MDAQSRFALLTALVLLALVALVTLQYLTYQQLTLEKNAAPVQNVIMVTPSPAVTPSATPTAKGRLTVPNVTPRI